MLDLMGQLGDGDGKKRVQDCEQENGGRDGQKGLLLGAKFQFGGDAADPLSLFLCRELGDGGDKCGLFGVRFSSDCRGGSQKGNGSEKESENFHQNTGEIRCNP